MAAEEKPVTLREKMSLVLIAFAIKILKPYQYDHEFKEVWDELKNFIKLS